MSDGSRRPFFLRTDPFLVEIQTVARARAGVVAESRDRAGSSAGRKSGTRSSPPQLGHRPTRPGLPRLPGLSSRSRKPESTRSSDTPSLEPPRMRQKVRYADAGHDNCRWNWPGVQAAGTSERPVAEDQVARAVLSGEVRCGSVTLSRRSVAFAAGQADAVEVFADGDRVLPGGAEQLAQLGHGRACRRLRAARARGGGGRSRRRRPGRGSTRSRRPAVLRRARRAARGRRLRGLPDRGRESATSGGLKPPALIASARSSLSFRSPWLSLGS